MKITKLGMVPRSSVAQRQRPGLNAHTLPPCLSRAHRPAHQGRRCPLKMSSCYNLMRAKYVSSITLKVLLLNRIKLECSLQSLPHLCNAGLLTPLFVNDKIEVLRGETSFFLRVRGQRLNSKPGLSIQFPPSSPHAVSC